MSLLKRLMLAYAGANFDRTFFSIHTPDEAYANRCRVKGLLLFLAQLHYRPAINMLRRFELADGAYVEVLNAQDQYKPFLAG